MVVDALLSGKAFDPIIEDWVEQFEEDEDQALGELVVFLLRVRPDQTFGVARR